MWNVTGTSLQMVEGDYGISLPVTVSGTTLTANDTLKFVFKSAPNGQDTGSMANNGSTSGTISTKAETVYIPAGYTSGGTVSISSTEQEKVIAGNIKSGVTLLGVSGSLTTPTISQDGTTHILSIS